jgi:uncharacterized protein (DUF427 family)
MCFNHLRSRHLVSTLTSTTLPSSLEDLALKLAKEGPYKILPTTRQIRLLFNGVYIAKTTEALLVWEHPYYPQYYLPKTALFESTNHRINQGKAIKSPGDGSTAATTIAHYNTISVGDRSTSDLRETSDLIIFADDLSGPAAPLRGLAKINFNAIDRWFEEDAPIHVHPKDPFKRIDILPSTRRVQVFDRKGGKQLADAASSMHLYETGLPVRYYLPMTSVDASLLRPSSTKTECPYKGEAEYYSVEIPGGGVLKDVVWYYDRPILESAKIEGEFPDGVARNDDDDRC